SAVVSSFLNSANASAGDFFVVTSPPAIFSGRSGNDMKMTTSPLPSAFRKISCSMLKHPVANKQHAIITAYPRTFFAFMILPFGTGQPSFARAIHRSSFKAHRFSAAIVNPIEQELERPVRLRAECDLRSKQKQLALADFRLQDSNAVLQILLSPGPAASERLVAVKPRDRLYASHRGVRAQPEHRAVVEEHIHLVAKPISQRIGVIDSHLQHRTR